MKENLLKLLAAGSLPWIVSHIVEVPGSRQADGQQKPSFIVEDIEGRLKSPSREAKKLSDCYQYPASS